MNENHSKKSLQKFMNALVLCEEKGMRCLKKFRDQICEAKNWEQIALQQMLDLRKSAEIKKVHEAAVAALNEFKSNQEVEKIRKKQKYNSLMKMYKAQQNCLVENTFTIHRTDREIANKKSFTLNALKIANGMYIGDANPPDKVAGFFSNEMENSIIPFEFDKNQHSTKEISDKVFALMGENSPYAEKWAEIFQG